VFKFYLVDRHLFQFSVHNSHFEILFAVRAFSPQGSVSFFTIFFYALFTKKDITLITFIRIDRNIEANNATESF